MSYLNQQSKSRRLNILILDGGGVRGLSSLLILRELMNRINTCINTSGAVQGDLMPHDIFKFVAGTSTGGLIAIMLGKLGMTVDDCIETYHELSTTIFKKKRFRGRLTYGLMRSKYCGKRLRQCVSDLLDRRGLPRDLKMTCDDNQDKIACAVVCRELESPSKYSGIKPGAICICNLPCNTKFLHPVCDAARATSAAPTFFPVVQIGGRCFVDGGMQYNNPSTAIEHHYAQEVRVQNSKSETTCPLSPTCHGDLNFSLARYVNIGTGTKTNDVPERRRDALASFLIPSFVSMGIFLKQTLTQVATDSEKTADMMRSMQRVSHNDIIYERFSAGHGVCFIKMDNYLELRTIETLTNRYLLEGETQKNLQKVAEDISSEYLDALRPGIIEEHEHATVSPKNTPFAMKPATDPMRVRSHQPSQAAQPPNEPNRMPSLRTDEATNNSTNSSNGCSSKSGDRERILSPSTSITGDRMTPLTSPDENEWKDYVRRPVVDSTNP